MPSSAQHAAIVFAAIFYPEMLLFSVLAWLRRDIFPLRGRYPVVLTLCNIFLMLMAGNSFFAIYDPHLIPCFVDFSVGAIAISALLALLGVRAFCLCKRDVRRFLHLDCFWPFGVLVGFLLPSFATPSLCSL